MPPQQRRKTQTSPRPRRKRRDRRSPESGLRYPRLRDLIALVRMMQGSAFGISLADIGTRFEVSRRTAERMRDAVRDAFIEVEELRLDDGTKRWRLKERVLAPAAGLASDDLAALETVGKLLKRDRHTDLHASLGRIGDAVRSSLRWSNLLKAEPDIEALALAEGVASRAGPRETIRPEVLAGIREAIKRNAVVRLTHRTLAASRPSHGHEVEPFGILYAAARRYLVGRSRYHGEVHLFPLGRVDAVEITDKSFTRPRDFDIDCYARQAFGVFQERPFEVAWHFDARAAADARTFVFHPTQKFEEQPDGTLIVRFKAGGLREMCWHLFTWGDTVEILKPAKLRTMYRRLLADARHTPGA